MNQLTKEHFDAAVAQLWNTSTCLLAQHAKANGLSKIPENGMDYAFPYNTKKAEDAMSLFDLYFRKPGDENKPQLQKLRDSLPINLTN